MKTTKEQREELRRLHEAATPLEWMPEPWRGPLQGEGVFCGPSPTVLS